MAVLTLRRMDGSSETRELSRSQPLTIGRQAFNDICISEDEVAPLHCRISWNKAAFEVTAATSQGVEVNSTQVSNLGLKSGDIIRVGTLDLVFHDEAAGTKPAATVDPPQNRQQRKASAKADAMQRPVEDMSLFDGEVQTASQALLNALDDDEPERSDDLSESMSMSMALIENPFKRKEPARTEKRPLRPGEQDVFKSPLVIGLTIGGLALMLITGIIWLFISREQSNRLYDRAVKEMNDGQYAQSITSFEKFIAENSKHSLRRQAERGRGKVLVLKEISGATPAWKRGLERLNELIKVHKSESDFSDLHPTLVQYADQIALGSAKTAETARDPEMLALSKEAQVLLERYSDPASPLTATKARIEDQRVKAERAIEKQRIFDTAMKAVDTAIADRQPMTALSERERLVRAFPDFATSKRVKEALQKSMDLEMSVVATDEAEVPAETNDDPAPPSEPVLGLLQARSRADETSQGRVVYVQVKDLCYAIDSVTGELTWRRVIGSNTPFFPMLTSGSQAGILMFDSRQQALVACQPLTGKLIWRQRLKARVIGKPLIHQGQIYAALEGNSLARIDVDSGKLSATVRFSQNLAASPVLSHDGNFLLVPGERAMIYSLSVRAMGKRPALAVAAMTFTDHAAGSLTAPPLALGHLLLLCENDQSESARLRLWNANKPQESLVELTSARVSGQVRDVPVLRGNQLVVPSEGEQFAAFVVSDDAGREGLTAVGQYRAQQSGAANGAQSSLYVALGADGQFWSAGTSFRRFEIGSNSIRMDSNSTAPGLASQPLQWIGDYFFVGRKSRYSDAVVFSAIDREKLVNPWRCILGDAPLEMLATRDGGVVWIGESGTAYSAGKRRLETGGVDLRSGTDLELPANVTRPIRATPLHDQRMVVFARGDGTKMFVFNPSGQLVTKSDVKDFPDVDPVLLDEGLVIPVAGRLKLMPLSAGKKPTQDWIAAVGEGLEHQWKHLMRVDGRQVIACDATGRLTRIQHRQGDVSHLAEVSTLQLEQPVDVRPVLRGEFLYVADASGTCRQLNVTSFDTDGQTKLPEPIKNIWTVDPFVIVHAGDGKLHCLADGKNLPERWTCELKNLIPAGPILSRGETLWLGCRDGTILVLNATSGMETRRIVVPQSLSLGLRQVGETLFAVGSDGALYRVEPPQVAQ